MRKKSDTVRYTAKQIKARIARGEDRTNWDRIDAASRSKLEASIRADVDDVRDEPDWTQAIVGIPAPKDHINIRIDHDVLQWFRSNGRGYQTLMNNVLRAFVQTRQQYGTKSK
ncbi:MAG TPA: BrnA antitoxin family protein [Terriglobia bacterium]|nr:BrnA antitoxin family protein [Terriglobia bacterium]